MCTILRKGCTQHRKIAILLQFRAIDTHDPTKGFIKHKRNRNFTTVSCDRHARSYERVHPAKTKSQFYYSFARSTRTILRKGSSSSGSNPYVRSCVSIARNCSKTTIPQAFSGPWRPPLKNIMLYLLRCCWFC